MNQPKTPIKCSCCHSTNVTYSEYTLCGFDMVNLVTGQNKFYYECKDYHYNAYTWA